MLLANLFLRRFSMEFTKKERKFSAASVKLLESYEWPGNVRELENRVQRGVIMSGSALLEPDDLGFTGKDVKEDIRSKVGLTLKEARDRTELEVILAAIERQGGNMVKAAEMLGTSRPNLYDLIKKHGIYKSTGQSTDNALPPE